MVTVEFEQENYIVLETDNSLMVCVVVSIGSLGRNITVLISPDPSSSAGMMGTKHFFVMFCLFQVTTYYVEKKRVSDLMIVLTGLL